MTLAILITNKNDSATLLRQLNSIINQTVLPNELIITDDGSTDNSKSLMQSFYDNHKDKTTVKLILHNNNKGYNNRINDAIKIISSKYFYIGSANDFLLPTFIESLHKGISQDAPIVSNCKDFISLDEGYYTGKQLMDAKLFIGGHTSCIKKEYAEEFGLLQETALWHADWLVYHSVCLKYGAYCIPKELSVMTAHPSKWGHGAYINQEESVINNILDIVRNEQAYDNIKEDFINHYVHHLVRYFKVDNIRL